MTILGLIMTKTFIFQLAVIQLTILLSISCVNNLELNHALDLAGENRSEFEKVLALYSGDPADSLKLRAAEFLIAYMPGHYSYTGDEIHKYYAEIDSLLKTDMTAFDMIAESERISDKYPNIRRNIVEDIHVITADYLIQNIDTAFELWEEKPWAEHLTFDQFCEYLLPYKGTEFQELDNWRDTLAAKFSGFLQGRLGNDQYRYSVYDAASTVNKDVKYKLNIIEPGEARAYQGYHYLSASTMSRIPFGNCDIVADLLNCIMRAQGIPSMVDYIPRWGRRNGRHPFYSVLDEKGNFLPFLWGLDSEPGTAFTSQSTAPKIFRITYKPNERILEYNRKRIYKDHVFPIFEIDVTDLYIATENINVSIYKTDLKGRYAYISVFSNMRWEIIDFGELKGRKVHFQKIARDHVYLVWGYDGHSLVPVSDPFIIRTNGEFEYLTPNTNDTSVLEIKRKYPKLSDISWYENRMRDGKIQASNRSDFADAETFYTFGWMPYPDLVKIDGGKAYRYWRFLSPVEGYGNVAEVEFYKKGENEIAKGVIIGTQSTHNNDTSVRREAAFDGDPLTFFDTESPDYSWVGLDFSSPVTIDRVRCIPRNDDNYIRIGDIYELFYWGEEQWNSLGRQIAEERVLYYDNVPSNALLWLRNLTRGREERIFTWENDAQRWW